MRRFFLIALAVVLALGLLGGCDKTKEEAKVDTKKTEHKAAGFKPAEVKQIEPMKPMSADFMDLVGIRLQKPIDFKALSAQYAKRLKGFVQETDKKFGTDLNTQVEAALDAGAKGESPLGNAQKAEKNIQRAFILSFQKGLAMEPVEGNALPGIDLVKIGSPVIQSVCERRSKWAGKGNEYTEAYTSALKKLKEAAKANDAETVKTAAAELRALSDKMIVLSVLYEINGLGEKRGTSTDEMEEKHQEGWIYYRSLYEAHAARNAESAKTVMAELEKPATDIDVTLVKKLLTQDFKAETAGVDPAIYGM